MRNYYYLSSQNIYGMKYIESKYGNKIGCELELNLSADQSHMFYKSETIEEQIWSENGSDFVAD